MSKKGDVDAFYVVRKGGLIGIYRTLSDCQAQAGSSVHSPSVSVYKGHGLPEEAEGYLRSHGLKNASYTISAADLKNVTLGELVPCPFQQPASSRGASSDKAPPPKRSVEALQWDMAVGPTSALINYQSKHLKLNDGTASQPASSNCSSCSLEFDGASRGNPGPAGAGAVLRADDGSLVWRLREGVGIATNNVAEYRGLILGLRHALQKGFKKIQVHGDSMLVCNQIQGKWKLKNQNMTDLCKVAKELKDRNSTPKPTLRRIKLFLSRMVKSKWIVAGNSWIMSHRQLAHCALRLLWKERQSWHFLLGTCICRGGKLQ